MVRNVVHRPARTVDPRAIQAALNEDFGRHSAQANIEGGNLLLSVIYIGLTEAKLGELVRDAPRGDPNLHSAGADE